MNTKFNIGEEILIKGVVTFIQIDQDGVEYIVEFADGKYKALINESDCAIYKDGIRIYEDFVSIPYSPNLNVKEELNKLRSSYDGRKNE